MEERRIIEKPMNWFHLISSGDVGYLKGGTFYTAASLYRLAEELKLVPLDIPIDGINISDNPFEIKNIKDFVGYTDMTNQVPLNTPIILDDEGLVAFGGTIIANALLKHRMYVKAYRLPYLPG